MLGALQSKFMIKLKIYSNFQSEKWIAQVKTWKKFIESQQVWISMILFILGLFAVT